MEISSNACGVLADAVPGAAVGNCVGALRADGGLLQAASKASAAAATPKRRSIMA
ncbi:hypothetical protein MOU_06046 [Xanthomonas citri pv. malvacearum str. GSPB1386]|nr:hypothetical protein WS7_01320 [Xanthomonas citri pv. malvacearum str. GSPB2388]EKQ65351.1 hypothetical protein MOU_06046 [Xanthomonas citri pv. malvacearum str. GSPB1386]